jgi:hypothetical protein
MSLQIIRIAGIIIGGTLGGYISGKIGEYIYNKKNKFPQIENKIEINQIPVSSDDDKKKIKSSKDLLNKEIKNQSNHENINNNDTESDNNDTESDNNDTESDNNDTESDNYFKNYLEALENEKKLKEKEMLFINDAIYDNDYYDCIFLIAK